MSKTRYANTNAKADAIARGVPVKELGYFESLNARAGLKPADGFKTAGPDEELLERPVIAVYIVTTAPATITVNGGVTLKPRKVYADGVHEYEHKGRAQTPAGQAPGILSVKISEGTQYKYQLQELPTGAAVVY